MTIQKICDTTGEPMPLNGGYEIVWAAGYPEDAPAAGGRTHHKDWEATKLGLFKAMKDEPYRLVVRKLLPFEENKTIFGYQVLPKGRVEIQIPKGEGQLLFLGEQVVDFVIRNGAIFNDKDN